jgi:hypothetical protein
MSGKSRQKASDLPSDEARGLAGCPQDQEPLLALLERALDELALEQQQKGGSRKSSYARGFLAGEALGRLYGQCRLGSLGPHGLALLIERMLDLPAAVDGDPVPRALFSGFCWQIEKMLNVPLQSALDDDRKSRPE